MIVYNGTQALDLHDMEVCMGRKLDLSGQTFGRWTVVSLAAGAARRSWDCRCACGKTAVVSTSHLTSGRSTQCRTCSVRTHGASRHGDLQKTYFVWRSLRDRCCNPNNPNYSRYGGRGITVCAEWLDDFEAFLRDMGPKPANRSIDRVDNDGPYCKDNCRWATKQEQVENMASNVFIEFNGDRRTVTSWARYLRVPRSSLATAMARVGADTALAQYLRAGT